MLANVTNIILKIIANLRKQILTNNLLIKSLLSLTMQQKVI